MADINNQTHENDSSEESNRGRQGFASMDPQRQKSIASKGGKAAHAQGTAHQWDSSEAREAGRKGGQARQTEKPEIASKEIF